MDCSSLSGFLDGELTPEAQAKFERHLVGCASCQAELEAAMQLCALGDELSQHPDRPQPVPYLPDTTAAAEPRLPGVPPPTAARRRRWIGAVALAAIAGLVVFLLLPPTAPSPEDQIVAGLLPERTRMERLPYAPLDRARAYAASRAGSAQTRPPDALGHAEPAPVSGDQIPLAALARLEARGNPVQLIAALIARGDIAEAAARLQRAGADDDLDVERAVVALRNRQLTAALGLLDRVLARSPRHPQATWNRAVVLAALDLPFAAAEAFDTCAALGEPGWRTEAAARSEALRQHELDRIHRLKELVQVCGKLAEGVVPDLGVVSRQPWLCRPSLYGAVRRATSRDEVVALLPVARAIDDASGDTASSALVNRIAASDFQQRGPSAALYRQLVSTPDLPGGEQARLLAELRASGQQDLVLGALLRAPRPSPRDLDDLVRLARASGDPYFDELATEYMAKGQLAAGKAIEAELALRQAVTQCAARDVELRCSYLHIALVELYLARHRPNDARDAARVALQRSQRLGLLWDERVLFDQLAQAARFERDYPQMRAYLREAVLRGQNCDQIRHAQHEIASAELSELRFASARAELDHASTCGEPLLLERAQIEAELARFDGTPARTTALRAEFDRMRHAAAMTPGQLADLEAIEGRLLSGTDGAAARTVLRQAIAAAEALGFEDVDATKARDLAYRTLLVLDATDGSPAVLDRFAAAVRAPLRPGCTLGAMIDGERLLLVARDAGGKLAQVLDPHAFRTPDFAPRTLVPPGLVSALAGCARIDVLALPPLYGQPQLLPPQLAWSYRGPAGAPSADRAPRSSVLTIEDARPPAALGLPQLRGAVHEPHPPGISETTLAGQEATPRRVRDELAHTDFAEIHAHGFVDLGISDVSLIALSPDADGSFALTARVIAGLKLPRAPFVALAACDAAYTAPYLHQPWSLPYAFLLAGARGVLAPATTIPDQEAGGFFRAVGDRILRGIAPAVVLRDQRLARRGGATDWVNSVVLFD